MVDEVVQDEDNHKWEWDEGSAGYPYQFCKVCLVHKDDVQANEFHGFIRCYGRPSQKAVSS